MEIFLLISYWTSWLNMDFLIPNPPEKIIKTKNLQYFQAVANTRIIHS